MLKQLKQVARDKNVKALILRISSPGGDALASDIMWHGIRQVAAKKPVVASMGDVAASGGPLPWALCCQGCLRASREPPSRRLISL